MTWIRRFARWLGIVVVILVVLRITGCMENMFYYPSPGPTPVPAKFVGAEEVWFESADGTRLFGWFIPSQVTGTTSDQAPSILHVHGNAGNIESHLFFTEFLPTAGFNLFIFDYRGYGQSEGSARKRRPFIEDTHAALDALLSRNDIDPNRIGMYGQSLGGSIGLNVMAERQEIRAAVIESAFTSWRDIAANAVGGKSPGPISRTLATLLIPDSHRVDEAVAKIERPLLLVHGTEDSIIPVNHSRVLAKATEWATLKLYECGEHNTLQSTHPEVRQLMINFFQEQLK